MNVYDAMRFEQFGLEPNERLSSLQAPTCFPSGSMKQSSITNIDDEGRQYVVGFVADDYLVWRD